jgi:drug/metabolite transporter (DMT)-like permease
MSTTVVRRSGPAAIFFAALLWSTGGLFIKTVSLDAYGVSFWRSLFAASTLFIVYWLYRKRIAGPPQAWFSPLTLFCALLYAALLLLFVLATKLTTSANAIFLQYTAPIYVLFAEPFLTGSRLRRSDLTTVILSTLAMALFFVNKAELSSHQFWGNIAALVSGVAFAGYALMMKHENATEMTRWHCVIIGHAFICLLTLGLSVAGVTSLTMQGDDLPRLAYLGIIQIGIAYAFFTYGLAHVRAIDATLISMVEPVLNPVWVFLGIGERPSNFAIVGGCIILAIAVYRTLRGSSRFVAIEQMKSGE